ncbi:hypothetical protein L9F63_023298, partial [Diploptera punctata]
MLWDILLFFHWRTPILFRFFPRESGKMLWVVFSSSPTGVSRYSSDLSLGSRGKCCGTFSPLLPMEGSDILQVFSWGVGENVVGRFLLFSNWRVPDILQVIPSGVGENVVGRFRLFSRWRIPILFRFVHSGVGEMLWDVFFLFSHWRIPILFKVFPSGVLENVVGSFDLFSHWRVLIFFRFLPRESEKCCGTFSVLFSHWRIPIFFWFFPRESRENVVGRFLSPLLQLGGSQYGFGFYLLEVGENIVGCFLLFSHWRIPIFFRFVNRESGKMLWDIFSSSPTGGSRYSSGFSLGSRGICCWTFYPILPLEGFRYSTGFSLGSRFFPRESGKNVVGRFLLFCHWRVPIFFSTHWRIPIFFKVFPPRVGAFPSGVGENDFIPRESGFSVGSRGKCCGTFSPLLPLEDPDILQLVLSGVEKNVGENVIFPSGELGKMFFSLLKLYVYSQSRKNARGT